VSAPKAGAAPVVGFNHNVQYGPRIYHVQTEDSGLPHVHYITHLFVGGNIVASMKSSYADLVDAEPDLAKAVRTLMEAQHKAMLKRLVSGEFNELAERLSAAHYEPGVLATGETGPRAVNSGGSVPPPPPGAPAPLLPKAPLPRQMTSAPARPAAPRTPPAPVWRPAPPGASPSPAPRVPGGPLPQTTRVPPQSRPPGPPPRMTPTSTPAVRPAAARPGRAAAPAAAAPPQNIFADDARPVEAPHDDLPTLFAEELISEKSLDEVILAFLSADLEPPK
jgi:hypothetical protein